MAGLQITSQPGHYAQHERSQAYAHGIAILSRDELHKYLFLSHLLAQDTHCHDAMVNIRPIHFELAVRHISGDAGPP